MFYPHFGEYICLVIQNMALTCLGKIGGVGGSQLSVEYPHNQFESCFQPTNYSSVCTYVKPRFNQLNFELRMMSNAWLSLKNISDAKLFLLVASGYFQIGLSLALSH